jgi:hypothetical protein
VRRLAYVVSASPSTKHASATDTGPPGLPPVLGSVPCARGPGTAAGGTVGAGALGGSGGAGALGGTVGAGALGGSGGAGALGGTVGAGALGGIRRRAGSFDSDRDIGSLRYCGRPDAEIVEAVGADESRLGRVGERTVLRQVGHAVGGVAPRQPHETVARDQAVVPEHTRRGDAKGLTRGDRVCVGLRGQRRYRRRIDENVGALDDVGCTVLVGHSQKVGV